MEVPSRDDCEMKHEAKLSLFGCYALDHLLPNTSLLVAHGRYVRSISSINTQAEPHTEDTIVGSSFPLDTIPSLLFFLTKDTKVWAAPALKQSYGWINSQQQKIQASSN